MPMGRAKNRAESSQQTMNGAGLSLDAAGGGAITATTGAQR